MSAVHRLGVIGLLLVGATAGAIVAGTAAAARSGNPVAVAAAAASPTAGAVEAAVAPDPVAGPVEVTMDRTTAGGVLGDHMTIGSTVTNRGAGPTGPLLAHLDVVSRHNDVYVDPEDWSDSRTVEVDPLAAGATHHLTWTVHNVNEGEFDLYVVLVPADARPEPGALAIGPPVLLAVAGRQTINPGSSLGVVVAVPLVLAAVAAFGRLRRRRRAQP